MGSGNRRHGHNWEANVKGGTIEDRLIEAIDEPDEETSVTDATITRSNNGINRLAVGQRMMPVSVGRPRKKKDRTKWVADLLKGKD